VSLAPSIESAVAQNLRGSERGTPSERSRVILVQATRQKFATSPHSGQAIRSASIPDGQLTAIAHICALLSGRLHRGCPVRLDLVVEDLDFAIL
jgi:hypothetical protein